MSDYFVIMFLSLFLSHKQNSLKNYADSLNTTSDTLISLFGNYELKLHVFNAEEENEQHNNSILTFTKKEYCKEEILFEDSLYCRSGGIQLRDFNNDGIKDVLIFYNYDVRGNEMNHLYIVNNKLKKLIRVKDFEAVKNPEFDFKRNMIYSHVISGTDYYIFYIINKSNKLAEVTKPVNDRHK